MFQCQLTRISLQNYQQVRTGARLIKTSRRESLKKKNVSKLDQ